MSFNIIRNFFPIGYQSQQPLQYTQPPALQHVNTQHQAISHTPQKALQYTQPQQDENIYYVCTYCETPTKFKEYGKLEKHVERFHSDFKQTNRGTKRKRGEEEVFPKKGKWEWS